MPHVPELVANFAGLLKKNKWDGASVDGARAVPLTEDVRVGLAGDHFFAKFNFEEAGAAVEIEARIGLDGTEAVLKNGTELPNGRITGKPLALVGGFPPKGRGKISIVLKHGTAPSEGSYRFDATIASS